VNPEIKRLHQRLINTHRNLSKRLGKTHDLDEAEAILREMEEVNFRVMMAGRLLFKETTAALDSRIETVISAAADLDETITSIEKCTEMIKAVGKFLAKADKVLDSIKLL
jgi:hypothetical protein